MYDLAGADPQRRFSPYCWRVRLALAHKGLTDVETIPWRFTDVNVISSSGQNKVPVLVHDGVWLSDSLVIAQHLERTFSDRPSLFGGPQGLALTKYYCNLADVLVPQVAKLVLVDIYRHLHADDQQYFRESRERRFGGLTLEQVQADRDTKLQVFRDGLRVLRMTLKTQLYLGGETPTYADYALFSLFQWARCISPFQLLAADDPIAQWRSRLLNAFDGLALSAPGYD